MQGAWFGDPDGVGEFLEAARNVGKSYRVDVHEKYEVYAPRAVSEVLRLDFVILPLSLPDFGSLWIVEHANKIESETRLILRSRTDADREALSQLYDGVFRPEDRIPPMFHAIEGTSNRLREPRDTGPLIQRVLQTSSHFNTLNEGSVPTLDQVRALPRPVDRESGPPLRAMDTMRPFEIPARAAEVLSFVEQNRSRPWVFLSYASVDRSVVSEVYRGLKTLSIPTWYDEEQVNVGNPVLRDIVTGLSSTPLFVVFLSRAAVKSEWVCRELALAQAVGGLTGARYFPVLLQSIRESDLPTQLRGLAWCDLRKQTERRIRRVVRDIASAIGHRRRWWMHWLRC